MGRISAELAKRRSDGATAAQGGYLGVYKRGELSKELEDQVFKMKKNELTPVIETKQGFLILQVLEHYAEGEQPFEKVEPEIMDRLVQPADGAGDARISQDAARAELRGGEARVPGNGRWRQFRN